MDHRLAGAAVVSRAGHVSSPVVIATIGVPGAGKSVWRERQRVDLVVNLDELRAAVSCCSSDQGATPAAVEQGMTAARRALACGRRVLWDATNAQRADRAALVALAAEHDARTTAVVLRPHLSVALARNRTRDPVPCRNCGFARRVPDTAIIGMAAAIAQDLPTLRAEGWGRVVFADQMELR